MTSVKKIGKIQGKYVLVRCDFNVPLSGSKVLDATRVKAALPTIELLSKKGARVILVSHIGREAHDTLKPVAALLKKHIPVTFVPDVLGVNTETARAAMKNGDVILLENLRSVPGEKAGDKAFAKSLAALADFYVNEAFPVSHRADASIVLVPKFLPAFAGIQFEIEVHELSRALMPKHPFVFIQGGAKAETKLPLLKKYLKEADAVVVGGVIANDLYKAAGCSVGASVIDADVNLLKGVVKNPRLVLPETVVVERAGKPLAVGCGEVGPDEAIMDISPRSIAALRPMLEKAKLVLWNGPMGMYKDKRYAKGTEALLALLASVKGEVIIGGGDTSVLVEQKKMADKFTFVSTAGGATLEFLAKGTLPGIKALT